MLHDGLLSLAEFVIGALQLRVQPGLMRGHRDVFAEGAQEFAFADAESVGPEAGGDEDANKILLHHHGNDHGRTHFGSGQSLEQGGFGVRNLRLIKELALEARLQSRFREGHGDFVERNQVGGGRRAFEPRGGLVQRAGLGVEEIDGSVLDGEMKFQLAEHDIEDAFQVLAFGNGVGDLVQQADARELLVQIALGALAQDRVANGAFEQRRVELALDEIIRGARSHGFAVHLMVAQTGQQNDGRLATVGDGGAQQFQTVVLAEPVVHEVNVVLVLANGLQARLVVFGPVQFEIAAADFRQEIPRQDIIVLIVLDEQHFQTRVIHGGRGGRWSAVQRSQTSICRGSSSLRPGR